MRRRPPLTCIGAPFSRAPAPALGGEQLLARRIVDGGDLDAAVDLERERRAENRQAVRVVRGAVERVEIQQWLAVDRTGAPRAPRRGRDDRETARRSSRGTSARPRGRPP